MYCIDDSYRDGHSYPGYFDQTSIYGYDSTAGRFVPIGTQSGTPLSGSGTQAAATSYLYVGMTGNRPNRVASDFKASGNFLNWLLMSKLDLEKKALTGGKFQFDSGSTTGGTLTAESRGCQGNRFVKIVPAAQNITFAVRGPDQPTTDWMGRVTMGEADYIYSAAYGGMSRIEIYDKQYNKSACLAAVGDWINSAGTATLRSDATACFGSDGYTCNPSGPIPPNPTICEADHLTPTKGQTYLDVMINCSTNPKNVMGDGSLYNDCILRIGNIYGTKPETILKGTGDDICGKAVSHPPTPAGNHGYLGDSYNYTNGRLTWTGSPEQQAEDYCRLIQGRVLTDPNTGNQVGTNVNIPSFILDAGIYSVGAVSATFLGRVYVPAQPTGLIQEFANDINFGAMVFNDNGSGTECKQENTALYYAGINYGDIPCVKRCSANRGVTFSATECYTNSDCPAGNLCYEVPHTDGGKVIAPVSSTVGDHSTGLIASIDTIRASSWTPLAESFYNAIGYFAGRSDLRLQSGDFSTPAPAALTCQKNEVLIISDGTSTADQAQAVNNLVATNKDGMPSSWTTPDDNASHPLQFQGSYNLDDLAWLAHNKNIADFSKPIVCNRDVLSTYVVYTGPSCGSYDSDGNCLTTDESIPEKFMQLTASKGGGKIANARSSADLGKALRDILRTIAAGAGANTSILATGSGNGAIYLQEQFYPYGSFDGSKTSASWIGEMQSLWYYIDPFLWGSTGLASTIREDTDGDLKLNLKKDRIVSFRPDNDGKNAYVTADPNGDSSGTGGGLPVQMRADQLKSLWKAGQLLWARDLTAAPRTIYTPLLPGGAPSVNAGLMQFSAGAIGSTSLPDNSLVLQPYLQVPDNATAVSLINYMQGLDSPGDLTKRSRTVSITGASVSQDPANTGVGVWKLGDIVSSTPQIESPVPLGSYNLAPPAGYNDGSYSSFICSNPTTSNPCVSGYPDRGMVYVGANDGMLHAFSLGKLDTTVSGDVKATLSGGDRGQEQWAFIPKNALPFLTYLTDPDYRHLYYVDGTLTLFDASIGDPNDGNCVPAAYPSCLRKTTSWRTVLIGGMGLGGASAASCAPGSNCVPTPTTDPGNAPLGYSSYFALDVTDPKNPTLLWEFSNPALGFSTTGPAIVRVDDPSDGSDHHLNGRWFAVFGSGPTGPVNAPNRRFLANSNQDLKFFVVDLRTGQLMATLPSGLSGAFAGSMSGGAIDVDRWNPAAKGEYQDDAVYVGYSQMGSGPDGGWGGGVLRIVTKENVDPTQWKVSTLISGLGPVTTGIARLQDRKNHNLWLYFGSGRYFYTQDDLLGPRALYGVREPCYNVYSGGVLTAKDQFNPTCTASVTGTLIDQSTTVHTMVGTDPGWVINLDPADSLSNTKIGAERLSATPVSSTSGAVFFTTFQPSADPCQFGSSFLWGVKYDTAGVMAPLQGKALVQLDTASVTDAGLTGSLTDKGGRRSPPMQGRPSGVKLVTNVGLKPVKKIIHIQER